MCKRKEEERGRPQGEASFFSNFSPVVLTVQNPKKCPQVEGLPIGVTQRHGKIRRDGYRT
jgi:2-keto-4-pentenoate hydratase/2-oxohepta-3-ene-1,7-dioic acid hydratase in catechol pathway